MFKYAQTQRSLPGRSSRNGEAGFSLIEIIIVLGIIGGILAVVANSIGGGSERASISETGIKANSVYQNLLKYQVDIGRMPSTAEGLGSLLNNPGGSAKWNGPYVQSEEDIKDAFDTPFGYELTTRGAKLISGGPNGTQGDEDDIVFVNGRKIEAAPEDDGQVANP